MRIEQGLLTVRFVAVQVPLQQGKGSLQVGFPVENHPESPVTQEELKKYLTDRRSRSWVQQISDFHFLLFVANFLDMRVRHQKIFFLLFPAILTNSRLTCR